MRRRPAPVTVLIIIVALPVLLPAAAFAETPTAAADDHGFVPIFDGRSLTGWHVSAKTGHGTGGRWVVQDGAIVGRQDPPRQGGIVITDRSYGDFEVELQMNNDFGPDSGLFLRSTEDGKAYQALIDYHPDACLMGVYGEGLAPSFNEVNFKFLDSPRKIVAVDSIFPLPVSPKDWPGLWKAGGWNTFRARIVGNPPTIDTWINGVKFMRWTDTMTRLPDRGGIALQVHGGDFPAGFDLPKLCVRYRNIRVKELNGGATTSR